jgi:hypothetical protein
MLIIFRQIYYFMKFASFGGLGANAHTAAEAVFITRFILNKILLNTKRTHPPKKKIKVQTGPILAIFHNFLSVLPDIDSK